ncbi:MAG TPA: NnrS family protein [Burkholderiaceae bacterium]|nr:NnrS family protein [Burkholderiaceae bacterium]
MSEIEIRRPGAGRGSDTQPPGTEAPRGFALWALGFRPLYLLAAAFAALGVPLWLAVHAGLIAGPSHMPAMLWHAHEMVYGFAIAVIAGFLFTAGQVWTGLPTPKGWRLAAICLLWTAARIANWVAVPMLAMALDAAFLIAVMLPLGSVLWRSNNTRNLFVLAVLTAFLVASSLFHLALPGRLPFAPMTPLHFAVFVVIILESVIAGRVVPMFTANAVRGVRQWSNPQLDALAIGATACALLLVLGQAGPGITAATCAVAAALQGARLAGWNPWATRHNPLLWILHVSYAWIPVGLLLLAFAALGKLPQSAGIHALTIGSIGGLIIGMITRTALGHTGRTLAAGRTETAMYLLVQAALIQRLAPMLMPALPWMALSTLAALAWSGAFVLYLIKYGPMLFAPRIDGRPG